MSGGIESGQEWWMNNNKQQYEFSHVVGKGGFGKVWKVEEKKTKKVFAMKEM